MTSAGLLDPRWATKSLSWIPLELFAITAGRPSFDAKRTVELLLGGLVDMVPLPPGTVRWTLVNVTLLIRLVAEWPQIVGLNDGLTPRPVMFVKETLSIVPMPGLLPQRRRFPIFIMIGERTP